MFAPKTKKPTAELMSDGGLELLRYYDQALT
jgi:hypothetical protein